MTRSQKITVKVFDYQGKLIQQWKDCNLNGSESSGLVEAFVSNGKEVRIKGGIIIMEEQ